MSKKKLAKRTLCGWSRSDIERAAQTLADITSRPTFACRKCARVANSPKSVCKPMPLPLPKDSRRVG